MHRHLLGPLKDVILASLRVLIILSIAVIVLRAAAVVTAVVVVAPIVVEAPIVVVVVLLAAGVTAASAVLASRVLALRRASRRRTCGFGLCVRDLERVRVLLGFWVEAVALEAVCLLLCKERRRNKCVVRGEVCGVARERGERRDEIE